MASGGRGEGQQRSAEDRARAAAERAARRAQREGRPVETVHKPSYDAPRHDAEPTYEAMPDEDPRALTAVEDRPLPPRRVPASRRHPIRRPPPRARARTTHGHARRRVGAVLALLLLGGALYLVNAIFQPFHGEAGGDAVRVQVPEGADAGEIGDLLAERGVVASGTFFQLNATVTGRRGGLRPGEYTLVSGMSYGDAISALSAGPKAKVVPTVNVTVPEGLSVREAAPAIDRGPLAGGYRKAATSPRVMRRIRKLGAPRGTDTPEGFLYPATYTLVDGSHVRDLVSKQLDAFEENASRVDMRYAKRRNLTRYDVLTIASMVEREAQLDRERPLVAAVIYNRLSQGMPLGIDATIRYETRNWSRPIRVSELEADTPYNSRLNTGLPPTPIGNPGQKSIEAAANPARKDYLFYVVKPCGEGEHAFSSTDAQFARDLEKYDAARAARGGKSPASC
jgi:UPF0755 protein